MTNWSLSKRFWFACKIMAGVVWLAFVAWTINLAWELSDAEKPILSIIAFLPAGATITVTFFQVQIWYYWFVIEGKEKFDKWLDSLDQEKQNNF